MNTRTFKINLNTIDRVKKFVDVVSKIDGTLDLVSGRYRVDAKSIMGIFSLDLSKDLDLVVHYEDEKLISKIENNILDFLV